MTRRGTSVAPLLVGALVVPTALTAFGFAVYGEEITGALWFTPSSVPPDHVVAHPTPRSVPVRPTTEPPEPAPAQPPPPSPEAIARGVASLFAGNGVKGITFAPGSTEHVGRGAAVQQGVGTLLGGSTGAVVTLVAHAWNGETASHRCDVLALRRAALVREFLVGSGVPEEAISTRVVVDPVWGSPSEGGPQVDVLVG
ncbi:hypothetical protein ACQPZF_34805 [Actinosynnema sp. CS-041913]|uniref:hypothetical protein n=1 Tax=Actinosynnema sp. CS-041913 TaxID=3239917 RepID=UPI003D8BF9B7